MNILVISNCPLNPEQGSGYVVLGYCQEMMKRGHAVKAFGPEHYTLLPSILPAKRLRLFVGYTLKTLREVIDRPDKYDIVELWGGVGWLSIILLKCFGKSLCVVSRSNGLEPHYRKKVLLGTNASFTLRKVTGSIESCLDGVGFRYADGLTLVSSFDEVFASERSYKPSPKRIVIENPLPNHWLCREIMYKCHTPVIGFVGSWNPNKGSNELAEIINLVQQRRHDIKWILVGVGPQGKKQITEQTAVNPLDIYVSVGKEKLEQLYSRMSFLLCLSSYESFGLACAEAMSFGCTLVSTNVGLMHALQEGYEYVHIESVTAIGVADLLVDLANKPEECLRIAQNGYRRVQRLQWNDAAERLESFYQSLLEAKRKISPKT